MQYCHMYDRARSSVILMAYSLNNNRTHQLINLCRYALTTIDNKKPKTRSPADTDALYTSQIPEDYRIGLYAAPLAFQSIQDLRYIHYGDGVTATELGKTLTEWLVAKSVVKNIAFLFIYKNSTGSAVPFVLVAKAKQIKPWAVVFDGGRVSWPMDASSLIVHYIGTAWIRDTSRLGLRNRTPADWLHTPPSSTYPNPILAVHGYTDSWGARDQLPKGWTCSHEADKMIKYLAVVFEFPQELNDQFGPGILNIDEVKYPTDNIMYNPSKAEEWAQTQPAHVWICSTRYLYLYITYFKSLPIPWAATRIAYIGTDSYNRQAYIIIPRTLIGVRWLKDGKDIGTRIHQLYQLPFQSLSQLCVNLQSDFETQFPIKSITFTVANLRPDRYVGRTVPGYTGGNDCFVWSLVQALSRAEDNTGWTTLADSMICSLSMVHSQHADAANVHDIVQTAQDQQCTEAQFQYHGISDVLNGIAPVVIMEHTMYGHSIPWPALPAFLLKHHERTATTKANGWNLRAWDIVQLTWVIKQSQQANRVDSNDMVLKLAKEDMMTQLDGDNIQNWLDPVLQDNFKGPPPAIELLRQHVTNMNTKFALHAKQWLHAMQLYSIHYREATQSYVADARNSIADLQNHYNIQAGAGSNAIGDTGYVWLSLNEIIPGWVYDNATLPFYHEPFPTDSGFIHKLRQPELSLPNSDINIQTLVCRTLMALHPDGTPSHQQPARQLTHKPFPPFCILSLKRGTSKNGYESIKNTRTCLDNKLGFMIDDTVNTTQIGYTFTSAVISRSNHFFCIHRTGPVKDSVWYVCDQDKVTLCDSRAAQMVVETQAVILIFHRAGSYKPDTMFKKRQEDTKRLMQIAIRARRTRAERMAGGLPFDYEEYDPAKDHNQTDVIDLTQY